MTKASRIIRKVDDCPVVQERSSVSTSVFCTGGSDGNGACGTCHGGCGEPGAPLVSLKDMDVGEKGTIVRLTSDDDSLLRRLISMGFVPSRSLQLAATVSGKGARVVKIGYTTIALDADAASAIFVRRGRCLAEDADSPHRAA